MTRHCGDGVGVVIASEGRRVEIDGGVIDESLGVIAVPSSRRGRAAAGPGVKGLSSGPEGLDGGDDAQRCDRADASVREMGGRMSGFAGVWVCG